MAVPHLRLGNRSSLRNRRTSTFEFRISDLVSEPMPQFTYRARNAQGGLVEGVLDCADRAVAIRQIEQQRCIPIRIDAVVPVAKNGESPKRTAPATLNLKVPHSQ